MIIRASDTHFTMITQHDHAQAAAQIAHYLEPALVLDEAYAADLRLAIREHDRCWLRMDATPIWNDHAHAPFGFDEYPLQPKLCLYSRGIMEIQQMSVYAAYLTSVHFASFAPIRMSDLPECAEFVSLETNRQHRLQQEIDMPPLKVIQRHSALLKCCDDLSLYLCLNRPGVCKAEEHPWFRQGFQSFHASGERMQANWISSTRLELTLAPFTEDFTVNIAYKDVDRAHIKQVGIDAAYHATPWAEQIVHICRK